MPKKTKGFIVNVGLVKDLSVALKMIKNYQKNEGITRSNKSKKCFTPPSKLQQEKRKEAIKKRIARRNEEMNFVLYSQSSKPNTPLKVNDRLSSYLLQIYRKDENNIAKCTHKAKMNAFFEIPLSEVSSNA